MHLHREYRLPLKHLFIYIYKGLHKAYKFLEGTKPVVNGGNVIGRWKIEDESQVAGKTKFEFMKILATCTSKDLS